MRRKMTVLAMAALFLAACATAPQQAPAGGDLTDEEVAAILTAINQGEVLHGEIARPKASSAEVRAFAEMMVTDHTRVLDRLRDTLSRANVTPADNQLSRQLQTSAEQTAAALRAMSGAELDRAYMRTQVDMHDWALRALDATLIPSTRSPQLLMLLRDARTGIAAHLQRARQVQGTLQ